MYTYIIKVKGSGHNASVVGVLGSISELRNMIVLFLTCTPT